MVLENFLKFLTLIIKSQIVWIHLQGIKGKSKPDE
jgi:hypothetical protein